MSRTAKTAFLTSDVLDHRLDYQVAVGEVSKLVGAGDPGENGIALVSLEAAFVDLAGEARCNVGDCGVGGCLRS